MYIKKNIVRAILTSAILPPTVILAAPQEGFTEMNVTGKTTVNIEYDVDDTKGIMNYAGVKYYKTCDAYEVESTNMLYTCTKEDFKLKPEYRVTDQSGNMLLENVNLTTETDKLGIKNFELSTEEGVHTVCLQTRDGADNNPGTGNISEIVCKDIFYDKTSPRIDEIILNGGNHWINSGRVPVTMKIYDNRAGIDKVTYDSGLGSTSVIDFSKPENNIQCTRNTHPALGDGSYTCTITAWLNTNEQRHFGDMKFKVYDKVGNVTSVTECPGSYVDGTGKGSCRMYYDLKLPTVVAGLLNSGEGSVNNNRGHIEYHIKDETHPIWISPSGIEQVIVENLDGSNQQWLVDERNNPDPDKTFDGILRDYIFNKCPAAAKFTVIDKAGNTTIFTTEEMSCDILGFHEFRVVDVVNPAIYNLSSPFNVREWNFSPNPVMIEADGGYLGPVVPTITDPYGDLPKALAGANMSFDTAFVWDGVDISRIKGYYTIDVYNTHEGYKDSWTIQVGTSNFRKAENIITEQGTEGVVYRMHPETFAIPKDAPGTNASRNSYTYVTINMTLTITTYEGEIIKTQTRIFPEDGDSYQYAHIAEVVGTIDDYLYFGELH